MSEDEFIRSIGGRKVDQIAGMDIIESDLCPPGMLYFVDLSTVISDFERLATSTFNAHVDGLLLDMQIEMKRQRNLFKDRFNGLEVSVDRRSLGAFVPLFVPLTEQQQFEAECDSQIGEWLGTITPLSEVHELWSDEEVEA